MQQVLYGGTRDGRPVGGARFYLGAEFIDRCVPKRRVAVVGWGGWGGGGGHTASHHIATIDSQPIAPTACLS